MLKVITSDTYKSSRPGALRCLLFLSSRGDLTTMSAALGWIKQALIHAILSSLGGFESDIPVKPLHL